MIADLLLGVKIRQRVEGEDANGGQDAHHGYGGNNLGSNRGMGVFKEIPHCPLYFTGWARLLLFLIHYWLPIEKVLLLTNFLCTAGLKVEVADSPVVHVLNINDSVNVNLKLMFNANLLKCHYAAIVSKVQLACGQKAEDTFKVSWRSVKVVLVGLQVRNIA